MVRWLPVPEFPNYEVSDMGFVRSLPRTMSKGGLLVGGHDTRGYRQVVLCKDGGQIQKRVHSLVLLAFVGPRPEGTEGRHRDGDQENCRLDNLSYATKSVNTLDQVQHGTHRNARKTHCAKGHPYDEANTIRIPSKPRSRICRECKRAWDRK